jgi:tetratricopeptide (TPR) repeat protein
LSLAQEREREEYRQKIAYCLEILEDDPKNIKYLQKLAECYYNIGNYFKAFETYNQIKTINPAFPRIDYWIDNALRRQRSENK